MREQLSLTSVIVGEGIGMRYIMTCPSYQLLTAGSWTDEGWFEALHRSMLVRGKERRYRNNRDSQYRPEVVVDWTG
jgi:hypothetical protein